MERHIASQPFLLRKVESYATKVVLRSHRRSMVQVGHSVIPKLTDSSRSLRLKSTSQAASWSRMQVGQEQALLSPVSNSQS